MNRTTRYFIAHALLTALVCFTASCGPQPGAGNNQNTAASNSNSATTKTLEDRCDYRTIQNNILTMINNSHSSREQYINVMTGPGEFFLHGFTLNEADHGNIIQATEQLIRMDPNCRGAKIDVCYFYKSEPVEGHPMLRMDGDVCAVGYQRCGRICIPLSDTCFIRTEGVGNSNTMPSPTRTPSPSPTAAGGN